MAIFRLEAKIFGREKRGRSIIAAAAYRAGSKLKDERADKTYDYSRRKKGIIQSVILTPDAAPDWARRPETLWNTVERGERRVDAQLAREFILALPRELNETEHWQTAVAWAQAELVSRGMVAEVSLHHPKNNNPHVHILCTLRQLDGDKFSAKKARDWNDVGLLEQQRESWAKTVNAALEKAGRVERVDHRSLKEQGIDKIPEPKIGVTETAMKRKGLIRDSPRFEAVRRIKLLNEMKPMLNAILNRGEVTQVGMGETWWERSISLVSRMREKAETVFKENWQKYLDSRTSQGGKEGPDITR